MADKAAALASYAKQSKDDGLMRMSVRIRDRAIRRAGEILKQIEPAKNQHDAESRAGDGAGTSRKDAAVDAGMSKRQQVTAIRVVNVPAATFEAAVEADKPATVTQLAVTRPRLLSNYRRPLL